MQEPCVDLNGDASCDFALDSECVGGAHAGEDELRRDACLLVALANADRQHFTEESGAAPALVWDERLWEVAKGHVDDMCARGYFEHLTPEGLGPGDRANQLGYDFSVGENIVLGPNTVRNHFAWMDEPTCTGHRGNILSPKNRLVGVAVIRCQTGRWSGTLMAVQNFHRNHSVANSDYCKSDATSCEMPPAPVSVAGLYCGNCSANDKEMLIEWGCPED